MTHELDEGSWAADPEVYPVAITVTRYQTSDGKQFLTREDAEKHQKTTNLVAVLTELPRCEPQPMAEWLLKNADKILPHLTPGWQPISTVPRTSTPVELWHVGGSLYTDCTPGIMAKTWMTVVGTMPEANFTHWRPATKGPNE